jgi:hypothetical protein
MISDILSQAVIDMGRWLEEQPAAYAETKPRIEILIGQMKAMQRELDMPPPAPTKPNDPSGQ